MMHMTLYWGTEVTILFDAWKTDSFTSYILSLVACFLVAAFYQYMEDRRVRFKSLSSQQTAPSSISVNVPLLASGKLRAIPGTAKMVSALLFGFNAAIGYLLMLAVMSFNGGVLLAVVAGLAVGYGIFRCGDGMEEENGAAVADNPCACA